MSVLLAVLLLAPVVTGCAMLGGHRHPIARSAPLDLDRYLGAWYVIAGIPSAAMREAFDPVRTLSRNPDGSVVSVLQFRRGGFAGTLETRVGLARVLPDSGNAEWRVQAGWLRKRQEVIVWVEPDYSAAVVADDARDRVWILSRTPHLPLPRLQGYRAKIAGMGYELGRLDEFPQNGDPPWR